jgi:hypothetical protein
MPGSPQLLNAVIVPGVSTAGRVLADQRHRAHHPQILPKEEIAAQQRSRELNCKVKKVHGKLQATTDGLGTTLKNSMHQTAKFYQSLKAMASKQKLSSS